MKPYDASQPQEDYCADCLVRQEGACNVTLKDGEECGDKITEEQHDFALASGDFMADADQAAIEARRPSPINWDDVDPADVEYLTRD